VGACLTVLGAGAILPRKGYGCAGYALRPEPGGPVTLLDCGPGSVRMLGEVGIALADVRRVVLSHFHTDHWLDLFALFFARRNPDLFRFDPGGPPELEVIGPVGLAERLARAEGVLGHFARDPRARVLEVALDARGRGRLECRDLALAAVRTGHAPEALAWRADLRAGHSIAYTGDTGENPDVADLARGADLFLSECSFPEEAAVDHHLTPARAGRLAGRAGCGELVLTHFYPSMDPDRARREAAQSFRGSIATARDASVHEIG
jgi:ribonuclease BN (tRNA processing enzyme)